MKFGDDLNGTIVIKLAITISIGWHATLLWNAHALKYFVGAIFDMMFFII